jgi:hypothetical protein
MDNMRGWVDVTELDVRAVVRAVYGASVPVGMGFLHARGGELDDKTLEDIIAHGVKYQRGGVSMDYVHGRQCKFDMREHEGKRYARLNWFDHGIEAMKSLLRGLGLPDVEARIAEAERGEEERRKGYEEENRKYRERNKA